MEKEYTGTTVMECLQNASLDIGTPIDKIQYEVIEEKKGLFGKKALIKVYISKKEKQAESSSNMDGTAKVIEGEVIIKDPKEFGKPAVICAGENVKVFVDEKQATGNIAVYETSKIKIVFEKTNSVREFRISTSEDKMEAHISIKYTPHNEYKLKNKQEANIVILEAETKETVMPQLYSTSDIKSELSIAGITFGIIDLVAQKVGLSECVNQIIARGKRCEDGIDDRIKINFNTDKSFEALVQGTTGNIDFKSIGSVEAVHAGDVIALYIKGTNGKDGCDVFGNVIKHKAGKLIKLKASNGCTIKDGSKVVSLIDGKPCIKNSVFYVYNVHEIKGNVDIESGNIKFIGDIVIYGGVKEGMTVDCGNSLIIYKDIERAEVKAKNNIEIKGNVIVSKVMGGGEDVIKLKCITELENINFILKNIILAIEEIKKFNLLGKDKKDGEIIKVLIESKFKNLTRLCIKTIAFLNMEKQMDGEETLVSVLRDKLIGLGPIKIQHYGELDEIINLINEKLGYLKGLISLPVEVKFSYCQDSKVESTGNIIITGKGEYVSELISNDGVYFTDLKSVTRGGSIYSKNIIKCRNVGSPAGVSTILKVEKQGHIWIDYAYQNTKIIVGAQEFIFEMPCKDIHAFIDSNEELKVERLKS
jgi:uncharacterized protein